MEPEAPTAGRTARILSALAILASLLALAAWALRTIPARSKPNPSSFTSVSQLSALQGGPAEPYVLAGAAVLALALLARRRELATPRAAAVSIFATLFAAAASMLSAHGHAMTLAAIAAAVALLLGLHLPAGHERPAMTSDRPIAAALWLLVFAVMCVFSMHRYWSYGAGSWDMGCMIHNFYRASRFLNTTSTVLGGVDFLGDHFMAGIWLYAPLYWLNASGYMLLAIQSANMAASAPAIYLIARHHDASRLAASALAIAAGFSFGVQSGAYFDSHEITVGFGFLAWGLWAFETRRLRLATVLFFVFALFKESLGAYVIALGLLAIWRGLRDRSRPQVAYGVAWIAAGALWFVLVNRVFMPALIARANPPEPHETFADFGPTVFQAVLGVLRNPIKALAALLVPAAKAESLAVTFGGAGWLAFARPDVWIAALPLLAERFLSSKNTMWEMGYHYAAPLCLYAAWGAASGWRKVRAAAERLAGARAQVVLAVYLAASLLLVNAAGYRHAANFHMWKMDYFSSPERRGQNSRALDLVRAQGRDASVAAQNRLLPHVADRPSIWRLGDWAKADWVVLSLGENAWPWDDAFPGRLAGILRKDRDWKLVFSEEGVAVFARVRATELPPVEPHPGLLLSIPGG